MLTKKICPNCGSKEVQLIGVGDRANWMCKDCGHAGNDFSDEEILGRESLKDIS